eukprot:SAG31_NODE_33320_length_345_cov_0.833333_1_plen_30_part_10
MPESRRKTRGKTTVEKEKRNAHLSKCQLLS